jgi:hypothetical protein
VLALLIDDEAPRSWRLHEKQLWASLPEDIRYEISRREREREKRISRGMNALADLRKKYETKETEENPTAPRDAHQAA